MIFLFTINLPAALSLYWLVGGLVAFWQQHRILREDTEEMEDLADDPKAKKDVSTIPEAEVVTTPATKKPKTKKSTRKHSSKKRRK
jgi:membrane protein insertase Oxa1/YidC/SpoIIIJ